MLAAQSAQASISKNSINYLLNVFTLHSYKVKTHPNNSIEYKKEAI